MATELEISAWFGGIALTAAELSTIQAYLAASEEAVVAMMTPEIYNQIVRILKGEADPNALKAALELSKRKSAELARGMSEGELKKMGKVIRDGIAEGLNPAAIARRLNMVRELDGPRADKLLKFEKYLDTLGLSEADKTRKMEIMRRKLLRDRRETIATTETRKATSEANQILAKRRGQKWKSWMTVGDERVSTIVCRPNESNGWVPIDDPFGSGHGHTPGHPDCRCTIGYRTELVSSELGEDAAA